MFWNITETEMKALVGRYLMRRLIGEVVSRTDSDDQVVGHLLASRIGVRTEGH